PGAVRAPSSGRLPHARRAHEGAQEVRPARRAARLPVLEALKPSALAMAGHSHSANIARRKGAVDQQRARVFNKCARALQSAVRQGGPDPATNLKLRYAIEKARACNMPKDNMERTIKRAVGEGKHDEELTYEGYGPGGVALMVTALTDNRHRTS